MIKVLLATIFNIAFTTAITNMINRIESYIYKRIKLFHIKNKKKLNPRKIALEIHRKKIKEEKINSEIEKLKNKQVEKEKFLNGKKDNPNYLTIPIKQSKSFFDLAKNYSYLNDPSFIYRDKKNIYLYSQKALSAYSIATIENSKNSLTPHPLASKHCSNLIYLDSTSPMFEDIKMFGYNVEGMGPNSLVFHYKEIVGNLILQSQNKVVGGHFFELSEKRFKIFKQELKNLDVIESKLYFFHGKVEELNKGPCFQPIYYITCNPHILAENNIYDLLNEFLIQDNRKYIEKECRDAFNSY